MFPIAFHPYISIRCQKGIVYAEIRSFRSNLLHGTATQTDFFESEVCDLTLAIHKQEYVNDLLQLTLNAKATKIGFLYQMN
jgi:hypothetical protein